MKDGLTIKDVKLEVKIGDHKYHIEPESSGGGLVELYFDGYFVHAFPSIFGALAHIEKASNVTADIRYAFTQDPDGYEDMYLTPPSCKGKSVLELDFFIVKEVKRNNTDDCTSLFHVKATSYRQAAQRVQTVTLLGAR